MGGGGIAVNALTRARSVPTSCVTSATRPARMRPATFEAASAAIPWKTVEQGAATSVLLAASPLLEGVSGRYFEDCREARAGPGCPPGCGRLRARPGNAARLWELSVAMLAA